MATKRRAVLVTTEHKGVFFGYAPTGYTDAKTIKLKDARNCIYWSASVKGFVGLAVTGPTSKCRVGPAATMTLLDVTAVVEVSAEAAHNWEVAPWSM